MLLVVIFEHSFQELFKDPLVAAEKDLPSKSIAFHALAERTCQYPGFELYDARSIWKRVQIPATSGHCEQAQATYPPYFNTCMANFLHSNLSKLKDSSSCP